MANAFEHEYSKPQFDIGRVISRTFSAIKNNFVSFFLASLIIMGLPMFLVGLMPVVFQPGGMLDGDAVNSGYMTFFIAFTLLSALVSLVGSIIVQGALIFGAVEDFNGRRVSFKECMSVALRYFFPLLGLAIVVSIGVMLGFLLFIIPGILVALGWSIAAPVLIIEKQGITDAMARSWELCRGYKRWILLLFIILIVLSAVIGGVLGFFTAIAGDPTTVMIEGGSTTFHFLNAIFSALTQTLTTMISATGVAAIYYEIRYLKEGIGAESLASIFD